MTCDKVAHGEDRMLYSDVYVDEPLDKIVKDWDFLNEKVIKKFYE